MDNCVLLTARNTPHKYCVLAYKLCMALPANLSYNLSIIFPVFSELVNVLNNYCFYAEQICIWTPKGYFLYGNCDYVIY